MNDSLEPYAIPFGIDLGTTRSAISRVGPYGRAELIDNSMGERLTPSAVWFSPDGVVVGKHARDMGGAYPDQVAEFFKRRMGDLSYSYIDPSSDREYSAADLSSFVLESLGRDAERATGQTPSDIVIAVPAYFGHAERTATYAAAEKVGMNVVDLINEPTAAVLAWMLDTGRRPDDGLLVYDLGGGTFDSVAVRQNGDCLEVVTIGGDNLLGGRDWDRVLTLDFAERFKEKFGGVDLATADRVTDVEWLERAEYAKIYLAQNPTARDHQAVLRHDGKALPTVVERQKYDKITSTLAARTIQATLWVLHHAKEKIGLKPTEVLLAGGMSRLPILTSLLKEKANLTPVSMSRPDYMVAEGAAIWALKIATEKALGSDDPETVKRHLVRAHGFPDQFADTLSRLRVRHVVSRGFAIEYQERTTKRKKLQFMALAQEELPISTHWSGATPEDDVTSLSVGIYEQGENRVSNDPRHHRRLGSVIMNGIPTGYPRDTPIEVIFTLDTDQVIRVSFTHPGKEAAAAAEVYTGDPHGTKRPG